MPAIIKEDKQVIALNEIENALSVIKDINTAVQEGNLFSISAAAPNERGATKIAITDEKDTQKIEAILVGYRAKLIKEANTKAAKYRIGLDEDDLACMEGKAVKKRKTRVSTGNLSADETSNNTENVDDPAIIDLLPDDGQNKDNEAADYDDFPEASVSNSNIEESLWD